MLIKTAVENNNQIYCLVKENLNIKTKLDRKIMINSMMERFTFTEPVTKEARSC